MVIQNHVTITGLTNGKRYEFRVEAVNEVGGGEFVQKPDPVTLARSFCYLCWSMWKCRLINSYLSTFVFERLQNKYSRCSVEVHIYRTICLSTVRLCVVTVFMFTRLQLQPTAVLSLIAKHEIPSHRDSVCPFFYGFLRGSVCPCVALPKLSDVLQARCIKVGTSVKRGKYYRSTKDCPLMERDHTRSRDAFSNLWLPPISGLVYVNMIWQVAANPPWNQDSNPIYSLENTYKNIECKKSESASLWWRLRISESEIL